MEANDLTETPAGDLPQHVRDALTLVVKWLNSQGRQVLSTAMWRDAEHTSLFGAVLIGFGEQGLELIALLDRARRLRAQEANGATIVALDGGGATLLDLLAHAREAQAQDADDAAAAASKGR